MFKDTFFERSTSYISILQLNISLTQINIELNLESILNCILRKKLLSWPKRA